LGALLRREHFGGLYAKAQNLRPWLAGAYDRALAGVDVLAMPTTPVLPYRLADELTLAGRVLRGWGCLANTYPTDMTGHPALTIPAADAEGPPAGVVAIGPRFAHARLRPVAATPERGVGW